MLQLLHALYFSLLLSNLLWNWCYFSSSRLFLRHTHVHLWTLELGNKFFWTISVSYPWVRPFGLRVKFSTDTSLYPKVGFERIGASQKISELHCLLSLPAMLTQSASRDAVFVLLSLLPLQPFQLVLSPRCSQNVSGLHFIWHALSCQQQKI